MAPQLSQHACGEDLVFLSAPTVGAIVLLWFLQTCVNLARSRADEILDDGETRQSNDASPIANESHSVPVPNPAKGSRSHCVRDADAEH